MYREEIQVKEFKYTITDDAGIHARPAGLLAKEAEKYGADVKIRTSSKEADAKRLFAIMSLGVKKGDEITISANGEDEDKAIAAVAEFLKKTL